MRKFIIAVSAAVLLLTGCSTIKAEEPQAPPSSSTTTTVTPAPIETYTPEPVPTEPEADTMIAKFGQVFTWEDGLQIVVSAPKAFKPSSYAASSGKFTKYVIHTVTVTNKTGKKVDLIGMARAMSGDQEADEVFDFTNNLGGAPSAPLLNGRKVTYKVAFGVANPNDIVFEYTPTFEHDAVVYTSTGS